MTALPEGMREQLSWTLLFKVLVPDHSLGVCHGSQPAGRRTDGQIQAATGSYTPGVCTQCACLAVEGR